MKPIRSSRALVYVLTIFAGLGLATEANSGVNEVVTPTTDVYGPFAEAAANPVEAGSDHRPALPSGSISLGAILPADRATIWNPGMRGAGGIPVRTSICSTLSPRGRALDDTAQIQTAIDACPPGEVVQLTAGSFIINSGNFLLVDKGVTLRGAGPNQTTLVKTDGAKPFPQRRQSAKPSPLIVVGPAIYADDNSGTVQSIHLTADAVKGENAVTVADASGFSPGQIVLLDETSGAGWQADRLGRGQIWASSDWRVVWQKHRPPMPDVDDFAPDAFPATPDTAGSWHARPDRPTAEVKQIASISGSTVTFTTPIHISYRISHVAQLSSYWRPHVTNAGVEDMKLVGGDAGNLRFQWAALSWARNIESTAWTGEGFAITSSFRIELREFYVHDSAWIQPGGGSYAISLSFGTAEALIENGISVRANKVIVAHSAGAGSVVAYNYMDMSYINYNGGWIETGINASHMVGSHHVLFEGNYSHNAESDNTHGNSIYHTFFRNYLRGVRAPFINQAGGRIDDAAQSGNGPKRAVGLMAYSYWMSFVGNVLGVSGQMSGWVYETARGGRPGIWMLGWDTKTDPQVAATTFRHGNFDYLTNTVKWDPAFTSHTLPNSLYLSQKPTFFDAGSGYTWPWVEPVGVTKLHTLPAKARYDAGTPFAQP
jgi:hypothetical protein